MKKDLYEVLGVDKDVSDEDIKKAYRAGASKHHPDKPTGDNDKFLQLQEAYENLSDSTKRAFYDENGVTEDTKKNTPPPPKEVAIQTLQSVIVSVAEIGDCVHDDLIELCRKSILHGISETKKAFIKLRKASSKYKNVYKRLKSSDNSSIYQEIFKEKRRSILLQMKAAKYNKKVGEEMLLLLENLSYEVDPKSVYESRMDTQDFRRTTFGFRL